MRRIRREHEGARALPLPQFKALLRDQFYMLLIDQEAALAAIPAMLPEDLALRRQAFQTITRILSAAGPPNDEGPAPARTHRRVVWVEGGGRHRGHQCNSLAGPGVLRRGAHMQSKTELGIGPPGMRRTPSTSV